MNVGFHYGIFFEGKLEEQAVSQGFTLGEKASRLEECLHGINAMRFVIDLPDSIYDKLIERLNKYVVKSLKQNEENK